MSRRTSGSADEAGNKSRIDCFQDVGKKKKRRKKKTSLNILYETSVEEKRSSQETWALCRFLYVRSQKAVWRKSTCPVCRVQGGCLNASSPFPLLSRPCKETTASVWAQGCLARWLLSTDVCERETEIKKERGKIRARERERERLQMKVKTSCHGRRCFTFPAKHTCQLCFPLHLSLCHSHTHRLTLSHTHPTSDFKV